MDKQGKGGIPPFVWVIVLVILGVWAFTSGPLQNAFDGSEQTDEDVLNTQCTVTDGSVTATYNDLNKYATGTDPASTFRITKEAGSKATGTITAGGTLTATPATEYEGLAGNNSPTYYAEKYTIAKSCADFTFRPELVQVGNATTTVINNNGATVNSASAQESVDADGVVTHKITMLAPTRQCVFQHGGVVAIDYDATYWSNFEPADTTLTAESISINSGLHNDTLFDSFKTFRINKDSFCNGEELTFRIKATATSTDPIDGADYFVNILGENYDVNEDTGEIIGPALYDEDQNIIYRGGQKNRVFIS